MNLLASVGWLEEEEEEEGREDGDYYYDEPTEK